jgi:hypothetical protein
MSKQDDLSADHISWLVKSRSANQETALKLFLIMKDNEEKLRKDWDLGNFAQAMVSACFSLWRAVFLSDVLDEIGQKSTIDDAQTFLGNLILHNMVAYPQDRNTRDWSFIYYVNNASYRLKKLSEKHGDILPNAFVDDGNGFSRAKDYWTFTQTACEVAIRNLETKLRAISN